MLSSEASVENPTEALIAISGRVTPFTNILMRELLPDEQDEIRLLAFSLLSEQENHLGEEISNSLKLISATSNKTLQARLQKNIGLLYWEIIYRQLLPGDLQNFILQEALQYTQQALQVLPQDAALQILLGKIYYRLGDVKASTAAFNHALELDASAAHVIPYLAEINYGKSDYMKLKRLFKDTPSLTELPIIGKVAQFWMQA